VLRKFERQGRLDTVQSQHSYEDLLDVRNAAPDAELMVQLNPFYEGTSSEVEKAIQAGADLLMLPMFHTLDEVRKMGTMSTWSQPPKGPVCY